MSTTIDDTVLKSLEDRVNGLHKLVFSQEENERTVKKPIEILEQTQCTLRELETRHSVILQLWKKLPDLDEYLTTDFLQKVRLNEDVKTTLILANEENVRNLAKYLDELKSLQNVVNYDSLKDIPEHSSKLEPIIQLHMQQAEEAHDVNERLNKLLTAYNNIINTMSKQFMLWNNFVTQCELAVDMERESID
ncbi:dynactin subunit 3-like [Hydractinia symbiolongicarpus]|uniref:dynactin subunit 3-like n=1 Tax=Hydractinia symbiolongicarpus TaxID=13093 RepID=UPI0025504A49|nr:dynactin subunit 3-like [Hydractinia symbiolongicarpus]XP_057289741.1 dynactin subunit 3-like [Hydractinia symbiolongicarpus]